MIKKALAYAAGFALAAPAAFAQEAESAASDIVSFDESAFVSNAITIAIAVTGGAVAIKVGKKFLSRAT